LTGRYRLRGAAQFAAVLRGGRRFEGTQLQLIALPATGPVGRVGYVIASRHLRRAIDRNRLKRMLREAVRARRPAMNAYDVVVRLRAACTPTDVSTAAAEGARLLDQVTLDKRR
jgi:ribonuclease P protein component